MNADKIAEEVLGHWIKCYQLSGLFHLGGGQMTSLRQMIAAKVQAAYLKGIADQYALSKKEEKVG